MAKFVGKPNVEAVLSQARVRVKYGKAYRIVFDAAVTAGELIIEIREGSTLAFKRSIGVTTLRAFTIGSYTPKTSQVTVRVIGSSLAAPRGECYFARMGLIESTT
jgi:hypothetical protein